MNPRSVPIAGSRCRARAVLPKDILPGRREETARQIARGARSVEIFFALVGNEGLGLCGWFGEWLGAFAVVPHSVRGGDRMSGWNKFYGVVAFRR